MSAIVGAIGFRGFFTTDRPDATRGLRGAPVVFSFGGGLYVGITSYSTLIRSRCTSVPDSQM